MLVEEVGPEEIAGVVSKWTGTNLQSPGNASLTRTKQVISAMRLLFRHHRRQTNHDMMRGALVPIVAAF